MARPSFSDFQFHAALRMPAIFCLLLVMIVSGCGIRGEPTGQTSIDRGFTSGGFKWKDGGAVYVFVDVRESQGKVEVCAAHMPTQSPVYLDNLNRDALGAAIVSVGGKRVMQGLTFANLLPETKDVVGQPATCRRGTADWKPSYANARVKVKFPRMKFTI